MKPPFHFARRAAAILAAAALAACASQPNPETQAREADYQQCLKDNMAVAMAWEAIEQMCRERTKGADTPLDYYPPQEP